MSVILTALKPDYSRRRIQRRTQIVPLGNYTNNGDPLDLSNILNPKFYPQANMGAVPVIEDIEIVNVPGGYDGVIVAGAGVTLATAFAVQFFTTAGAQVAAGAYPAVLLAVTSMYLRINQSTWS